MQSAARIALVRLILSQRWAALATSRGDEPYASMVAYVAEPDLGGILLHLSRLARHTRNVLHNPRGGLVISTADPGDGDPQTLPRASIQGAVQLLTRDASDYTAARALYIARFPDAAPRFAFGDFELFRLLPEHTRYVAGFGQTYTLAASQLRAVAEHPG